MQGLPLFSSCSAPVLLIIAFCPTPILQVTFFQAWGESHVEVIVIHHLLGMQKAPNQHLLLGLGRFPSLSKTLESWQQHMAFRQCDQFVGAFIQKLSANPAIFFKDRGAGLGGKMATHKFVQPGPTNGRSFSIQILVKSLHPWQVAVFFPFPSLHFSINFKWTNSMNYWTALCSPPGVITKTHSHFPLVFWYTHCSKDIGNNFQNEICCFMQKTCVLCVCARVCLCVFYFPIEIIMHQIYISQHH